MEIDYKEDRGFRLLNMYERLNKGEILNKADLVEKFGVSEKTIQRDIDAMRAYLAEQHQFEKEKLRAIRKENAQAAREICKDIFDELDIELQGKLKSISDIKKVLSLEYNDRNVLHEQNNIFKIFINDENEDDICMLFHHFIRRFTSKMVKKYDVTDKIKN